jgi:hypothetical protein
MPHPNRKRQALRLTETDREHLLEALDMVIVALTPTRAGFAQNLRRVRDKIAAMERDTGD